MLNDFISSMIQSVLGFKTITLNLVHTAFPPFTLNLLRKLSHLEGTAVMFVHSYWLESQTGDDVNEVVLPPFLRSRHICPVPLGQKVN